MVFKFLEKAVIEMTTQNMSKCYFDNPIIAAVRDVNDLELALQSKVSAIFLLTGNLMNIKQLVTRCKGEKYVFLHVDLVAGLGNDSSAIKFLAEAVKPDGIISTRSNLIKFGKELGLYTIQRYFCMDSLALHTGIKAMRQANPDTVELLPGIIPRVVSYVAAQVKKPIIAGGMIVTKEDVMEALNKKAIAVSTSCKELWNK
jgi:glycerol uptake operon antiterminator